MAFEPKPNTGSLFKNDRKEEDTHSDYKGTALIGGVEYWLSAWIKPDKNGNKFMSLSFKVKGPKGAKATASPTRTRTRTRDIDEEIPF